MCGDSTTFVEREQRIVGRHRLGGEHVQRRPAEPPAREGVEQRGVVDEGAPRRVDEPRPRLHPRPAPPAR